MKNTEILTLGQTKGLHGTSETRLIQLSVIPIAHMTAF